MLATNTSSTKSPLLWQATPQPSNLFAGVYGFTLFVALAALWQCPVETTIRLLLIGITGVGGILNFVRSRPSFTLQLLDNQLLAAQTRSDVTQTGKALADRTWDDQASNQQAGTNSIDNPVWCLQENTNCTRGRLSSGSYRSQLLVVVAIKPDKGATRFAVIWRDSVPPTDFSFVQMRLAMVSTQQLA